MTRAKWIAILVVSAVSLAALGCPSLPGGPEGEVGSGRYCSTCTNHFRPDGQRYTLTSCSETAAERDRALSAHALQPGHNPMAIDY